jgi:hypothetical protein
MHPAVLNPLQEQGRQLLIQLQALSDGPAPDGLAGNEGNAEAEEALLQVDGLLRHQIGMTLEIVGDLEFAQLRAEGPRLCEKHADDVRALIDVMLESNLDRDKNLRLLEYLITLLATDEVNGRRTVVTEPSDLTPGLRALGRKCISDTSIDAGSAETVLGQAMSSLIRGEDHLSLRDEIRTQKRNLGRHILHPRILSCTVAYNVAMWNQVAVQIDSTMAIDQLADDLLTDLNDDATATQRSSADGAGAGESHAGPTLASKGFARLVSAFSERIRGGECGDPSAARVVNSFKLDGLRPREILALEADDDGDAVNQLIRTAVVLGRAIRQQGEIHEELERLQIAPELLEAECLPEMIREMTSMARTLFAESRYSEAFELSEVKTRNLAALAVAADRKAAAEGAVETTAAARPVAHTGWRLRIGSLPAGAGRVIGLMLGLGLMALMFSQLGGEDDTTLRQAALMRISPFLTSAVRQTEGDKTRLVAKLGPTWDYVATPQRETAVAEIGERVQALGIDTVVLMGPAGIVFGRYENGEVTHVVPNSTSQ